MALEGRTLRMLPSHPHSRSVRLMSPEVGEFELLWFALLTGRVERADSSSLGGSHHIIRLHCRSEMRRDKLWLHSRRKS